MNAQRSAGAGIGFNGALFLLFLGLKLTGHITWSWWWVSSPLWAPLAVFVAVVLIALFLYLVVSGFTALALYIADRFDS